MAKQYAAHIAMEVTTEAVQIHGGYGYCSEYGIEQIARDSKIGSIYEGTNAIQALDFLTRKVFGDKGVAYSRLLKKVELSLSLNKVTDIDEGINLLGESLKQAKELMKFFQQFFSNKKNSEAMYHSVDYLKFNSNLIVSWRLLVGANIAAEQLANATGDRAEFLKLKIEDFKIYCRNYLARNKSIYYIITGK